MFARIVALALSTCSTAAMAQTRASPPPAATDDDILVVGRYDLGLSRPAETGSRLGLTPLELPASIATVDGDAIRARGDLTVVDAVSRAPGITQAANPGNGNTALAARGFVGQGSVLQLVDGIRLFPTAGTITFPTDPWNVERIEVLSGPASVLCGQGALGGAVNVVTKRPSAARRLDLEASYGAQDTVHLAAGLGGPLGDALSYRADASFRHSDGWVDRGGSHGVSLGGALRYAPSDQFSLTVRGDYGDVDPMTYFGTPLIDGRLDDRNKRRNYNVADADIDFRDDRVTVIADWRISDAVSLTNAAYRLSNKRQWYNLESYCWIAPDADGDGTGECRNGLGSGTPGRIYRADNLGIVHDTRQIGDQGSVRISTPFGERTANDLVIGLDVNRIKLDYSHNFAFADQSDEVDPFVFEPGSLEGRAQTLPRYLTRTTEWSVFAEDRLKLGERFSVVGGVRYEEDRVRRRNFVYDADGVITGEVNAFPQGVRQRKLDNLTWRVGAVYRPAPTISLYGQYATGVDPLGTLTTFTTSATQFFFSNAKGDQVEAGAKASFLDGRGSATLAAYRIVKNDLVAQRTPTSPVEQVGKRSSTGVEAAIALSLANGFSIDANGTVLNAEYDEFISGGNDLAGNTPPDVPETAANIWLTWQGIARMRAQAGLRYVGRRFSDDANNFRVPSYTVVDLGLSYAFTDGLAVDLRLYNLLNEDYVTSTYYDEQWLLGRPRSIDVALRARF